MTQAESNFNEHVDHAMTTAEALGRVAGKKLNEARLATAAALNSSATTVRETGAAIDDFATSTAASLDSGAASVRRYEGSSVLVPLQKMVIRHPLAILGAVTAAGFLFGYTARKQCACSRQAARS